jgi:acetylxylan esterase
MNLFQKHVLAGSVICLGLLAAAPARAATLTMVPRATWGATGVPSYMQMYIYVPDNRAAKPPIYISCHSCGNTASNQLNNIPVAKAAADSQGFILILPDNQPNNCWDVGTTMSLKHDGGGDTQAVAQMIKYVIKQYNADPARVYIMGGSGGAMLVQAMAAVYPDLIRAGSARAGVPAGCWADGYSSSNQWSNTCAAGSVTKTAQQWGDLVRAMYPGYTGHRPRLQTYQGDADTTISYKNTGESIKEWTNVLGLSMTPTSMDTGYKPAGSSYSYNRQFWKNSCGQQVYEAWTAPGANHSMTYEENEMLKFFGLASAGQPDPEMDCGGTGGAGGTTGAGGAGGGSGGTVGAGGRGGTTGAGGRGGTTGSAGTTGTGGGPGSGGTVGAGGGPGTAGTFGAGGSPGNGGSVGSGSAGDNGGTAGTFGAVGTGGTSATGTGGGAGGVQGTAGTNASGGNSGGGGSTMPPGDDSPGGCSCALGGGAHSVAQVAPLVLGALGLIVRRRRRSRR